MYLLETCITWYQENDECLRCCNSHCLSGKACSTKYLILSLPPPHNHSVSLPTKYTQIQMYTQIYIMISKDPWSKFIQDFLSHINSSIMYPWYAQLHVWYDGLLDLLKFCFNKVCNWNNCWPAPWGCNVQMVCTINISLHCIIITLHLRDF